MLNSGNSSGSSGRVKGAEKHEFYAAAFGSHPFYDFFYTAGGHGPLGPPGSATGQIYKGKKTHAPSPASDR